MSNPWTKSEFPFACVTHGKTIGYERTTRGGGTAYWCGKCKNAEQLAARNAKKLVLEERVTKLELSLETLLHSLAEKANG